MRRFTFFLSAILYGMTGLLAQTNYTCTFSANVEMDSVQVKNTITGESKMLYIPDNMITLQQNAKQETSVATVNNSAFIQQTANNKVVVNVAKSSELNLKLYSTEGKVVARYANNVNAGQYAFQIGAKAGVYVLVATARNQYESVKLLLKDDEQTNISEITTTESMVFLKSAEDIITFNEGEEFEFTGYYKKQSDIKRALIIEDEEFIFTFEKEYEEGTIKFAFSVSEKKQVCFSQGNLQYQASTKSWRFANNQYDIMGEENSNVSSSYSGWIDLFGWGTSGWKSGSPAYLPWSTNTNSGDYLNYHLMGNYEDADWGVYNKISNGGNRAGKWRTLTYTEWDYVLSKRTRASALCGSAIVNGVEGIVLLPDNWSTPHGVTFNSGLNDFGNNIYTINEWVKMEMNGAVFLPAAGYRDGMEVKDVGSIGFYWSSEAYNLPCPGHSYSLRLTNDKSYMVASSRRFGQSVRLVRDVKEQKINLSKAEICFSQNADSQTLNITTKSVWYVESNSDWITVTPIGGKGNGEITVSVLQNPTGQVRESYIRIVINSEEKVIVVTQSTTDIPTTEKNEAEETIEWNNTDDNYLYSYSTGSIKGVFSISKNSKIAFSMGNLQYQANSNTWRFAENQYDIIGNNNKNISPTYSDWIDLFGWGTSGWNSGANAYQPYSTSKDKEDYVLGGSQNNDLTGSYANADWGVYNKIINGENTVGVWRTLTYGEWNYILDKRTDANVLKGFATVNDINGIVLLPDNWSTPEGVTFSSGMKDFETNIYSITDWAKMETNGAVFLPAAGKRDSLKISFVGASGHYWSSSESAGYGAGYLFFQSGQAFVSGAIRPYGYSVRLVCDLKKDDEKNLDVSKTELLFTRNADSKELSITSQNVWYIENDSDWITVTPIGGKGNDKIIVSVSQNTKDQARESYIRVTTDSVSKAILVSQSVDDALTE